jgi:hypothetical protein
VRSGRRGSMDAKQVPAGAPAKPSRNHQGTPFIAVSTTVLASAAGQSAPHQPATALSPPMPGLAPQFSTAAW